MNTIAPCLPNPDSTADPDWSRFTDYLKLNNIIETKHPAVDAYQNSSSGKFLSASQLNHCLALRYFGTTGIYADRARDLYGDSEDDWDPQFSIDALDGLFSENSYRFGGASVVFKGIGSEPFYEVLDLPNRSIGDVIIFSGFLSTSVCRQKAENFASGRHRVLLEITRLEHVDAIIPPNKCVLNSPTSDIPEQEVLLRRGLSFEVVAKFTNDNGLCVLRIAPSQP